MPRPLTYDHLRSSKKPNTKTIEIVLDPELSDRLREAQERHERALLLLGAQPADADRADEMEAAQAALEAARAEAEEAGAIASIVVRSIGRPAYDRLQRDFPPNAEQVRSYKRTSPEAGELAWDPDLFPIALIAACTVEPALTVEQATELWDSEDWNLAECMAWFYACIEVNQQRRVASLGKGSG